VPTASMTWRSCGTAGSAGTSTRCMPRARWVRSRGRSGSATCASSTRSPGGCWPARPGPAGASRVVVGVDDLAPVALDDTIVAMHGYAKQGAGLACSGVRGLFAAAATVITATTAPVIVATTPATWNIPEEQRSAEPPRPPSRAPPAQQKPLNTPPIGGSGLSSGWSAEIMGDAGPKLWGLSPGNRPGTVEPVRSGNLDGSWIHWRRHHRACRSCCRC
jgi:hypothetical protein